MNAAWNVVVKNLEKKKWESKKKYYYNEVSNRIWVLEIKTSLAFSNTFFSWFFLRQNSVNSIL